MDARTPLPSPGTGFWLEHIGVASDEFRLLLGRQLDHPGLVTGMKRREDPAAGAEIGMSHVRAFNGSAETQGDAPERVCGHGHGVHALRF